MKNLSTKALAALILSLLTTIPTYAQQGDLVKAALIADAESAAPGGTFTLGVRLRMKSHWHTYWANPGEAGEPTQIKLTGPAGFEFGAIQWPIPSKLNAPGGVCYGYEDEVMLMVPVTVAKDAAPGTSATIQAAVSWLVCKDECQKGSAKLKFVIAIEAKGKADNADVFEKWRGQLPVFKAADRVTSVEQLMVNGAPLPALVVGWKAAPKSVEWFPVSTDAVAINDVNVKQDKLETTITFKPTVYHPQQAGGMINGVLVYADEQGNRHGVIAPIRVATPADSK